MNIAEELTKVREKIDTVISWVSGTAGALPTKHPNRRLKLFMDQYEIAFGTRYEIRDQSAEGGAAKRTEMMANDPDYLAAVRAYLADLPEAFGAPFFKFSKNLEFWLKQVRGKKGSW